MGSFTIRIANWQDDNHLLRLVRETVFIKEQQIPIELEWDEFDDDSLHVLATDRCGTPIGTARVLADGHIGRMAVLKEWRGKGVGSAMLNRLLEEIKKQHIDQATLNAQTEAVSFYKKFGFQSAGDVFIEAGIPHIKMVRKLF